MEFYRAKTVGPPQLQKAYIKSELEVRIVKRYMECLQLGAESKNSKEIHLEKNHGQRLFRKLLPIYFPGQAVGKHTLASYG